MTTVTVLSGPERRRRWTTAEKLRIVEESLAPGTSVVEVARRHDVHRNLVTAWRRQVRTGVIACGPEPLTRRGDDVGFAAVSIAPDRQPLTAPSGSCGAIEIEFAAGARMRITGAVDAATLSAVVAALTDGRPR
ncbi:transposase [Bradyrhizobium sp. CSA207]|uniref:IS66-like element accessory protein TnpA n=1 Tax=Bradyrhizobium sp. CSA207 TaxID=2698826 RepID=UPI0023AF9C23|nr:transposase [Bradyrhizobium sp. CSA207]MDE5446966.1 transposase [Bradyrhizobium sp. CSA207]